jgi:hypothetical protein
MSEFIEEHSGGLWVPRDAVAKVEREATPDAVIVDNRTDLPDDVIFEAVGEHFVESTGAFGWGTNQRYLSYQAQGSMLGRAEVFRPPSNVIEEIEMARDLAERDDDVAPAIEALINTAYAGGYANQHEDEQVQHTFDAMTEDNQLLRVMHEMHREFLIANQITTVSLNVRGHYEIYPEGVSRVLRRDVATPLIGVLPSERVRVVGDDTFFDGELAYVPDGKLEDWLRTFFDPNTSPAKKAEMRRLNPVRAAMFLGPVTVEWNERDLFTEGMHLYKLNPEMVQRTTGPKGEWKYPRPRLTRNFPLLEAKRLLNIMDFSLLQGGTNFIVVVKKGSEKRPALPAEIENLKAVVQRASRSGVLIGDHRLSLDIVTPDLKELLNPDKRRMIGRKLAMALIGMPEYGADETSQSVEMFAELFQNNVTADRNLIRTHIERNVWSRTMKRNARVFGSSKHPKLWMPKIILQGNQFFTDYLLKMYDRGDLPRKFMVEYGGYDFDAVKAQKEREQEHGHDDIFQPPPVPFTAPNQHNAPNADPNDPYRFGPTNGPNDNGGGRPRGSGPNNGAPGAKPSPSNTRVRPRRTIRRTRGETVKAIWDDEASCVVRIGELTHSILQEHDPQEPGRLQAIERRAIEERKTLQEGPRIVIPVAVDYEASEIRAMRFPDGSSLLVGRRSYDNAFVTVAVSFREPEWDLTRAEDTAAAWGFDVQLVQADYEMTDPPEPDAPPEQCPKCGAPIPSPPGQSCESCGYEGAPFSAELPEGGL